MSKEEEARVRDELLQGLYASVLRVRLAQSLVKGPAGLVKGPASLVKGPAGLVKGPASLVKGPASLVKGPAVGATPATAEAVAAGLEANLQTVDLIAGPRRGGIALQALRGASSAAGDLRTGLLPLPQGETVAAAFVLGALSVVVHQGAGAVLVVLLPPSAGLAEGKTPATALPKTWAGVGAHAARLRLPLLFVSEGTARVANPDPAQPPPAFPTIPVDRDDALAIYRVVFECAQRARLGAGPSHLACVPRPRKGSADGSDALVRLETMLRARGAFGKSWRNGLERRLIRELTEA